MTVRILTAIAFAIVLMPGASAGASTTAYKCVVDGRTIYGDQPCLVGRQSVQVVDAQEPLAADRIAADARLRDDRRALAALERDRQAREARIPVSRRVDGDRARQARLCARLTLRAQRAREDDERAAPRDRPQKQLRTRRAEEDRAAACPKR